MSGNLSGEPSAQSSGWFMFPLSVSCRNNERQRPETEGDKVGPNHSAASVPQVG